MPLPRPTRQTAAAPEEKPLKHNFRPSDVFRFAPKDDITVAELAHLISIFWTLDVNHDKFFTLEDDLQPHFRPIKSE